MLQPVHYACLYLGKDSSRLVYFRYASFIHIINLHRFCQLVQSFGWWDLNPSNQVCPAVPSLNGWLLFRKFFHNIISCKSNLPWLHKAQTTVLFHAWLVDQIDNQSQLHFSLSSLKWYVVLLRRLSNVQFSIVNISLGSHHTFIAQQFTLWRLTGCHILYKW